MKPPCLRAGMRGRRVWPWAAHFTSCSGEPPRSLSRFSFFLLFDGLNFTLFIDSFICSFYFILSAVLGPFLRQTGQRFATGPANRIRCSACINSGGDDGWVRAAPAATMAAILSSVRPVARGGSPTQFRPQASVYSAPQPSGIQYRRSGLKYSSLQIPVAALVPLQAARPDLSAARII